MSTKKKRLEEIYRQQTESRQRQDVGMIDVISDPNASEENAPAQDAPKAEPTQPTMARKRTTINLTEEDYYLAHDLLYTIQSSGGFEFKEEGNFRAAKKDLWAFCIHSLKEKVESLYGQIKESPESKSRNAAN